MAFDGSLTRPYSSMKDAQKDEWKPVFKPGSIFYEPSTQNVHEPASNPAPEVQVTHSKNSVFFQDFTVFPSSKSQPSAESGSHREIAASRRSRNTSIFEADFSVPITRTQSLPFAAAPTELKLKPSTPLPPLESLKEDQIQLAFVPTKKNFLGEGRYSRVYRVSDVGGDSSEKVYAVKCTHAGDEEAHTNGIVEAFVFRKMNTWVTKPCESGVISFHGLKVEEQGNSNQLPSVLLMFEYCQNGSLADFVLNNPDLCGRRRWVNWCQQITRTVAYLHSGNVNGTQREAVIHRDIKPHNIFLNGKLETRLGDFGNANYAEWTYDETNPVFTDGLGKGTQAYSAPETLEPPEFSYSMASDIYSLGATFYFLLTGREPFSQVRNPAHQLFCIKRGFFESGANPLSPISHSLPPRARPVPTLSLPQSATPLPSSQTSIADMGLLRFRNGETLHSSVSKDLEAFNLITSLIKKCTARNPQDRPTANEILVQLKKVDDTLILGDGFGKELIPAAE